MKKEFKCYGHNSWISDLIFIFGGVSFVSAFILPLWVETHLVKEYEVIPLWLVRVFLSGFILILSGLLFQDKKTFQEHSSDELIECDNKREEEDKIKQKEVVREYNYKHKVNNIRHKYLREMDYEEYEKDLTRIRHYIFIGDEEKAREIAQDNAWKYNMSYSDFWEICKMTKNDQNKQKTTSKR